MLTTVGLTRFLYVSTEVFSQAAKSRMLAISEIV
jgi:hypothetical protein